MIICDELFEREEQRRVKPHDGNLLKARESCGDIIISSVYIFALEIFVESTLAKFKS